MDLSPKIGKDENMSPTRRERRRQEVHDRLLDSATALFVAQGYQTTSVDDIAREADVARATAFNYFPRKEDYLAAWVEGRRDRFKSLMADDETTGLTTGQRLLRAFVGSAAAYEADQTVSRPIVREWLRAGGPLMTHAAGSAQLIGEIIAEGQRLGHIRADVDAAEIGGVMIDVYYGALYRWAREDGASGGLVGPVSRALNLVLEAITDQGRFRVSSDLP